MSENTTTTFADNDDLPDDIPLGNNSPLLVPPPLGQSFLQPKFLYPLGAVSIINPDKFSLESDFEPLSDSFNDSPFFDNPLQSQDSGSISPSNSQVNLQTKSLSSSQKPQVQRSPKPNPKTQSTSIQRKTSVPSQPSSLSYSLQSISASDNQEITQDLENDAQLLQNSSDLSISSNDPELNFSENVINLENTSVQRSVDNSSIGDITANFTDVSLAGSIDNTDLEGSQNSESSPPLIQKSTDISNLDDSTKDNTILEDRLIPSSENSSDLTTDTTSSVRDISTPDIQRESQSSNVTNSIENTKNIEKITNLESSSPAVQRNISNTIIESSGISDNIHEPQAINSNVDSSSLISPSVDSNLQSEQSQPIQRTTNLSTDINASEDIVLEADRATSSNSNLSNSNLSSKKLDSSSPQSKEIQRQIDSGYQANSSDHNEFITTNSSYSSLATNISEGNSLQIPQENLDITDNSSIESIQRNLDISNTLIDSSLSLENNLTPLIQRQIDTPIVDDNSYQENTLISNLNQTALPISNHNQLSQLQNLQKQSDTYTSNPSLGNSISKDESSPVSNAPEPSSIDLIQTKLDITVDNQNQSISPIKSTQDDTNISVVEEVSNSNEFLNSYTTQDSLINSQTNNDSINTSNINQLQAKTDLSSTVNNDIPRNDLPSARVSEIQPAIRSRTADSNLVVDLNTLPRSVISPNPDDFNVQRSLVSEVSEDSSIKGERLDTSAMSVDNIESPSQINDYSVPVNSDSISESEENNNSNYDITQSILTNEYSLGVQRDLDLSSSSDIVSQNNLEKSITRDSSQIAINENLVDREDLPTIQTQLSQDNLSDINRDNIEQSISSTETSNLEQPLVRNVPQIDINKTLTDTVASPVIQTYLDQDDLSNTTNIDVDNIEQSILSTETSDLQQPIEGDISQTHINENFLDIETTPTLQTQLSQDNLSNINIDNTDLSILSTETSDLDIQKKINLDNISSQNDLIQDEYGDTNIVFDDIHLQSTHNQNIQRRTNAEIETSVSSNLQNSNVQRNLNALSQESNLDNLSESFISNEEINDPQLNRKSTNSDRIDTFTNIQKQESQEFPNLADTSISSDTVSTSDTNDIQSDRLYNQIQRRIDSSPNNLGTDQGLTDLSVEHNLSSSSQEIITTSNLSNTSYANSLARESLTQPSQLQRSNFNSDGTSISDIETNIDNINALSSSPEPEIQRSLEISTINNPDSSNIELTQEIPLEESSQEINDFQSISTDRNLDPNGLDNIDSDIQRQSDQHILENSNLLPDDLSSNFNDSTIQLDSSQSVVENIISRQIKQEDSNSSSNNNLETKDILTTSTLGKSIQREIDVNINESNDFLSTEITDSQADVDSDVNQISYNQISNQVIQTSLDSVDVNSLTSELPEISNSNSVIDDLDSSYTLQPIQPNSENITELEDVSNPLIQRLSDLSTDKSINTEYIIPNQSAQIARDLSSESNSSATNLEVANDYLDAPLANKNNSAGDLDKISNGSAGNIQRQFADDSIADRVDITSIPSTNFSYDLPPSLSSEDSNALTSDRSQRLPVENSQSSIDLSTSNFNSGVDETQPIQRQVDKYSSSSSVDLNDSDRDLVDVQSAIDIFGINERIPSDNTSSLDLSSEISSNDNLNISTSRSNEIQREFDASTNEISNINEVSARDQVRVENIDLASNSNVERSISTDTNIQRYQLDSGSFINENTNDIGSTNIELSTSAQELVTTPELPIIDNNISLSEETRTLQRTSNLTDTSIDVSNNISIQGDNQYDQQLSRSINNIDNTSISTNALSPQLQRSSELLDGSQLNRETNADKILSQDDLAQAYQEIPQIKQKGEVFIPDRSLDTHDLVDIGLTTVESSQNDLSVSSNESQVFNFSSIENIDTISPPILQTKLNLVDDLQPSSNIIGDDFHQDNSRRAIQRDILNNSNLDDSNSVDIVQTNEHLSNTESQIIQDEFNLSQTVNNIDNNILETSNNIQAKYINTDIESTNSIDTNLDRNVDANLDGKSDNSTANTSNISVQKTSNISEVYPEASSPNGSQELDLNLSVFNLEDIQRKLDDNINNIQRVEEDNISTSSDLIQPVSDVNNRTQNIDDLNLLSDGNILNTSTNISAYNKAENINNISVGDHIAIQDIQRKTEQDVADSIDIQEMQRQSEQDEHTTSAESLNTNDSQDVVDSDRIAVIQPKLDTPQLEPVSQSQIISAETTNQLEEVNEPTVIQRLSDPATPPEDLTLPTVLQNLGQTEPLGKFPSLIKDQLNHQFTTNNLSNLSSQSNPSSQSNSSNLSQLLQAKGDSSDLSSSINKISTTPTSIQPKLDQNQTNDPQETKSPSWSNIAELLAKMPPPKVSSNPSTNPLSKKSVSSSDRSSLAIQPKSSTTSTSKQTIIQRSPDDSNDDDLDLYITPTGLQRGNPNQVTNSQVNTIQRKKDPHQESENLPEATVSVNNFQDNDNKDEASFEENLTALAQEIYVLLRQRLEIEKERQGSIYRGRLPW